MQGSEGDLAWKDMLLFLLQTQKISVHKTPSLISGSYYAVTSMIPF